MCGILGFASDQVVKNCNKILDGAELLNHRGPDDSGDWLSEDGRIGFAHRRLSIVDLTNRGRQPMTDFNNRFTIVFNGEIYNYPELFAKFSSKGYKFNSKTDTEVILAAYQEWGEDCTSHLNGMFSFAIFDSINNTLFLSRDRAGEKPLFYGFNEGVLLFSSEIKAILYDQSIKRIVNSDSLDFYLSMGFIPGERSIFKNIKKLPAASSLLFNLESKKIKVWKYWRPFNYQSSENSLNSLSESELLDKFEDLLEESVKKQMVADVDVGVLLSGGVDSSLITAMACRNSDRVKTFTVGFPGFSKLDERGHARLISKHFNTDHTELAAEEINSDLLIKLASQFDEPIIDSSMLPTYLLCELVQKHCKVVLGGDGADELFGGYEHHSRMLWMKDNLNFIPKVFKSSISSFSKMILPHGFKGKNWLQNLDVDFQNEVPLIASYFDVQARKNLMRHVNVDWETSSEGYFQKINLHNGDILERSLHMDFTNYLAEDILVKVDRASMINSLEVRSPFLDKNIIEFAFNEVPSHLKANSKDKKIFLKQLSSRILPSQFDRLRKQGFDIPINDWLKKGPLRDFFYNVLLDPQTIFDKKIVKKLLRYQDMGFNNGERLFSLVMFELWRREYKVSF
jgi:asparagine synthase (glutamine-hydrolysing)